MSDELARRDRGRDRRRGEVGGTARARAAALPGPRPRAVRFEVLSEGERGLLGVGYTPGARRRRPSTPTRCAAAAPDAATRRRSGSSSASSSSGSRPLPASRAASTCDEDDERITRRLHRARPRPADRPPRADDRRAAVPRQRDRARRGDGPRKEVVVDAAGLSRAPPRGAGGARRPQRRARRRLERARRARADDRDRAQGRPPAPRGLPGRRDDERGRRAEPLRRHPPVA